MKLFICQFCNKETTNAGASKAHENHCNYNPHKQPKSKKWLDSMTSRSGSGQNQFTKARRLGLPVPKYDKSHLPLQGAATASKEQRSLWAKEAGTGGYKENAGRSKKFRVNDSFGVEVLLQSSYELLCSKLLNDLNIKWIRPTHLKYDNKKYFADFYLVDYDIYLDPKNKYKAKLDEEKIQRVVDTNAVRVYVLTEDKLTKQYLQMLVSPNGEGLA